MRRGFGEIYFSAVYNCPKDDMDRSFHIKPSLPVAERAFVFC
jgi:hypothetical protein